MQNISRRSFLKLSGLTAVAVAGTAALTGCSIMRDVVIKVEIANVAEFPEEAQASIKEQLVSFNAQLAEHPMKMLSSITTVPASLISVMESTIKAVLKNVPNIPEGIDFEIVNKDALTIDDTTSPATLTVALKITVPSES